MGTKQEALQELEGVMTDFGLTKTEVGLAISNSPSFMDLMRDPKKSITTVTLDRINRYVLGLRGQLELDLDLDLDLDLEKD